MRQLCMLGGLAFSAFLMSDATLSIADGETNFLANIVECNPKVEVEPREQMLHLRRGNDSEKPCEISEDHAAQVIGAALKDAAGHQEIRLIFLGRLDTFPWLVQRLKKGAAVDQAGWDAKLGKPRHGNLNTYVAQLVARADLAPFGDVLSALGYRLVGASVEKVMVSEWSSADGTQGKRFPSDALIHLRIEKIR